jgi:hypothetical protein
MRRLLMGQAQPDHLVSLCRYVIDVMGAGLGTHWFGIDRCHLVMDDITVKAIF